MHGQVSYGPQFSQGSRPVAQNSYLQQSVAPSPHAPNNFQQGHLPLPSHRLPQGLPAYQQGPMASRPELQQVPLGGITNAGQSLSQPHSAVHGNAQLPHSYPTAQQNSQQPSCLSSGELLLPGLHPSEVQLPSRGLVAVSSLSQSSNGVPINHPPQQLGNVHGLRHIPPPPGPHSTSRLPTDPYGSSVHSTSGNSHMSSMGPVLPALEIESSMQHNHLMVAAGVHSPVDSDMEMEDDITTQSDNDLAVNQHTECPTQVCGAISSEFDLKEQPQTPLSLAESNAGMVAPSDSMLFSSSSGLAEQVSNIHSLVIDATGATGCPSTANMDILSSNTAKNNTPSRVSASANCVKPDKYVGQVVKVGSPITLIQDYASDDTAESFKEPSKKDLVPTSVSSVVAVGAESMCKDSRFCLELNMGSTVPSKTEKDFLSEPSISYRGIVDSQTEASIHIAQLATAEQDAANHENKISFSCDASPKVLVSKDACGGECSFNNKLQRDSEDKNASIGPKARKIDKFGRLVREGGSDSDSDDSHNARRHNKRGKSRSRSRSPVFRRRIRSPRRTRERRGRSRSSSPRNRRSRSRTPRNRRSRSRSPRNRRSRSRSPSFRRSGQLSSSNITRDRVQMTQCFDFLRGRCYRGSSCRYSHHDMERYEGSRHHRDIDQKAMTKEMQPVHDMTASSIGAINDAHTAHKRKGSVNVAPQHVSNEEGQLVDAEVLETKVVQERTEDYTNFASKSHVGEMEFNQILMAVKTVADTAILKSCGEASRDTIQRMAASVHDASQQAAHDSSSRLAENANTAPTTHSTRDHNLVPITAVQSLPASSESFPSYMLPNQNTLFAGTANSSWTSLPTRPPIFLPHDQNKNAGVAPAVASLPSRIDFGSQKHPRPSLNELSGDSQVYDFQRQLHHSEQESHQPLLHGEDVSFKPLPGCNASTQQSVFPSHFREDQSSEIPLQGLGSLDSFIQGSSYRKPVPFLQQELPAIKLQPFPGNSCSPGEILKSSSQNHPFLQQQQQQPPYFLRQPLSDSVHSLPGRITSSRYPPDLLDRNQPSQPHDFSTSTVSTNYNPYASTFDPISSRFGSDISRPEKVASHKCDHPLNLGCPSIDGQDVASVGSRRATSSSDSLKGIGHNPRSGDNQYDPLFDSIEPSSNSYKNFDHSQKPEPNNDSDSMLRISGSNGPLDVEETNKKEIGGINLATSLDNEGCGETTDADVGDMENASQINLNTTANIDMGEMEIDQIKSPVKSKRSKESRSLKLFKVCLAEFVKEVLKPSWRQGNMSKEAFKTVVKKTVDKVSGAMKSHHIPKSKAKINQYIDSSQLKLTKLVMGYVDKYAKG